MRVLLLALFLALTAQAPAMAHRVNIFAYVEGNDVLVECVFSTSSPVRDGQINVFDSISGEELLQGKTDDKGFFRFPVPEKARAARNGLRISPMPSARSRRPTSRSPMPPRGASSA